MTGKPPLNRDRQRIDVRVDEQRVRGAGQHTLERRQPCRVVDVAAQGVQGAAGAQGAATRDGAGTTGAGRAAARWTAPGSPTSAWSP